MAEIYAEYNLTGMGNSTGIVDLMQTVNTELMFSFFGIGILVVLFLITFFAFLKSSDGDATRALAGSCFICFGMSLLLRILELIPPFAVYICLIGTAISVLLIKK